MVVFGMKKTNTVTWIIDLSKGETKTFTVVATVVGYGNVTNSLTVGNKTLKNKCYCSRNYSG